MQAPRESKVDVTRKRPTQRTPSSPLPDLTGRKLHSNILMFQKPFYEAVFRAPGGRDTAELRVMFFFEEPGLWEQYLCFLVQATIAVYKSDEPALRTTRVRLGWKYRGQAETVVRQRGYSVVAYAVRYVQIDGTEIIRWTLSGMDNRPLLEATGIEVTQGIKQIANAEMYWEYLEFVVHEERRRRRGVPEEFHVAYIVLFHGEPINMYANARLNWADETTREFPLDRYSRGVAISREHGVPLFRRRDFAELREAESLTLVYPPGA